MSLWLRLIFIQKNRDFSDGSKSIENEIVDFVKRNKQVTQNAINSKVIKSINNDKFST